ncbi:hypothetical protein RJT62_02470 [Buchnera aphidicola (Mindarus keteleerifoliae)]|uniref:hypothetical protein n=1 Tax=Buchnera aphidicola TaxID=9 RepID=UPI0031B7069D
MSSIMVVNKTNLFDINQSKSIKSSSEKKILNSDSKSSRELNQIHQDKFSNSNLSTNERTYFLNSAKIFPQSFNFFIDEKDQFDVTNMKDEDLDNPIWQSLSKEVPSKKDPFPNNPLQKSFIHLKNTSQLNNNFIKNLDENVSISLNGKEINGQSPEELLANLKKDVPSLSERQLISTYVQPSVFKKSLDDLQSLESDFSKFKPTSSKLSYKLDKIGNGKYTLLATSISQVKLKDSEVSDKSYSSYGVRAFLTISPYENPIIKYSFFMK